MISTTGECGMETIDGTGIQLPLHSHFLPPKKTAFNVKYLENGNGGGGGGGRGVKGKATRGVQTEEPGGRGQGVGAYEALKVSPAHCKRGQPTGKAKYLFV